MPFSRQPPAAGCWQPLHKPLLSKTPQSTHSSPHARKPAGDQQLRDGQRVPLRPVCIQEHGDAQLWGGGPQQGRVLVRAGLRLLHTQAQGAAAGCDALRRLGARGGGSAAAAEVRWQRQRRCSRQPRAPQGAAAGCDALGRQGAKGGASSCSGSGSGGALRRRRHRRRRHRRRRQQRGRHVMTAAAFCCRWSLPSIAVATWPTTTAVRDTSSHAHTHTHAASRSLAASLLLSAATAASMRPPRPPQRGRMTLPRVPGLPPR